MAKRFNKLPSEILNIDDEYTAFCFDEACACIMGHLENDETPMYIIDKTKETTDNGEEPKQYSSMEDFYKDIGVEG